MRAGETLTHVHVRFVLFEDVLVEALVRGGDSTVELHQEVSYNRGQVRLRLSTVHNRCREGGREQDARSCGNYIATMSVCVHACV